MPSFQTTKTLPVLQHWCVFFTAFPFNCWVAIECEKKEGKIVHFEFELKAKEESRVFRDHHI